MSVHTPSLWTRQVYFITVAAGARWRWQNWRCPPVRGRHDFLMDVSVCTTCILTNGCRSRYRDENGVYDQRHSTI